MNCRQVLKLPECNVDRTGVLAVLDCDEIVKGLPGGSRKLLESERWCTILSALCYDL